MTGARRGFDSLPADYTRSTPDIPLSAPINTFLSPEIVITTRQRRGWCRCLRVTNSMSESKPKPDDERLDVSEHGHGLVRANYECACGAGFTSHTRYRRHVINWRVLDWVEHHLDSFMASFTRDQIRSSEGADPYRFMDDQTSVEWEPSDAEIQEVAREWVAYWMSDGQLAAYQEAVGIDPWGED